MSYYVWIHTNYFSRHRYFTFKVLALAYYYYAKYVRRYSAVLGRVSKYSIDTELGIEYRDSGPWRSYRLTASGANRAELKLDATIEEIDQDGGTLRCYGLDEADNAVYDAVVRRINRELLKRQ